MSMVNARFMFIGVQVVGRGNPPPRPCLLHRTKDFLFSRMLNRRNLQNDLSNAISPSQYTRTSRCHTWHHIILQHNKYNYST